MAALIGLALAALAQQSATAVTGGTINGTVSGAGSGTLAGAQVDLYEASSQYSYTTTTADAQGKYSFDGVTPGSYKIRFRAAPQSPWFTEFWNDKATFALADAVSVTNGSTSTLNASLTRGLQIKGTVTNDVGATVPNASVWLYKGDNSYTVVDYLMTDASGKFASAALPAGDYKVYTTGSGLVGRYYNNKRSLSEADPVAIASADVTVNPVVQRSGGISGKLSDPDGNGVGGWWVSATNSAPGGSMSWTTTTNQNGTYSLPDLEPGEVTVRFSKQSSETSEYATQWYNGARTNEAATKITVEAAKTVTGIDATLWKGGSIAGKVTGPTGTGIAGVTVSAKLYSAQTYTATTGADGTYRIPGLDDGDYTVGFSGPAGSKWISEYYDDQPSYYDADTVELLNSASVTDINAELTEGALLAGTLSASSGTLSNAYVVILNNGGYSVANAYPAQNGSWSVAVPAGTYKIMFGNYGQYLSEYWDDVPDLQSAKAVTVAAGETRSGLDAVLDKGATISGTVTPEKGSFSFGYVYAEGNGTSYGGYVDQSGKYTISGLPTGDYSLRFTAQGYQTEYWDDKPDAASADKIAVTKGQDITGKNAVLSRGAILMGKVVDTKSAPVSGIRVSVRSSGNQNKMSVSATTQADGTYSVSGLAAGTYVVDYASEYFSTDPFVPQFYSGKSTWASADRVTVAKNEEKALNPVTLNRYSALTGTVRDSGASPVPGARVTAYQGEEYISGTTADASGKYTLGRLPAGSYRLQLSPPAGSSLVSQWWDGMTTIFGAKKVVLGPEQVVPADLVMRGGASIAGTVTGTANEPLAGVTVKAVGPSRVSTTTAADGTYQLTGLRPGKYAVSFTGSTQYWKQWYNGEPTKETADQVQVDFADVKTGVDAKLADSPYVTGKITAATGPVEGAEVSVYETNTDTRVAWATTDSTGLYRTKPLAPGKYDVYVDGTDELIGQWYTDAEEQSDATTLVVAKDQPTVADLVLKKGATIHGTVTGPDGPVVGAWVSAESVESWDSTYTDAQGQYSLGGLPAGDYTVHVWPSFGNSGLIRQYYNGKYEWESADKVTLAKGATASGINFSLTTGTSISGKIVSDDGRGTYFSVEAYRKATSGDWESFTEGEVSDDGTYTMGQIPPGEYKLVASGRGYNDQWWNGKDSLETATPITVGVAPLTGRDFVLPVGPGISGKVTVADGQAFDPDDMEVEVYRYYEGDGFDYYDDFGLADDGTFLLSVPQGTYKIAVNDYYRRTYARQFWSNKASLGEADPIEVGTGRVSGKDFVLQRTRKVSGSVVLPPGVTSGVSVVLTGPDGHQFYETVAPGAEQFSFAVAPGTYTLMFSGKGVLTEWWQDKASAAQATPITVTANADVTGLVAVLAEGAKVSGTVTGVGGMPLDAQVRVLDADTGLSVAWDRTDPDGQYAIAGLPAGSYVVRFDASGTDYAPQWFSGAAKRASATTITLAENGAVTADATLTSGAILTGKVTDQNGDPLAGAPVTIQNVAGEVEKTVLTNTRGVYTALGLEEDSYLVRVHPPTARLDLLSEWYENAATRDAAKAVDVLAGKTATVNVGLVQGATISGTVTGPGGKVAKGIGVDVFDTNGDKSLTAWTDSDGTYRSSALEAGTYKVRFKPGYYGGKGMVERWWKDKQTMATSTAVTISANQQVTGIDATLGSVGNAVAPGAPTAVTATAGDSKVLVKWQAPASNGGLPITKYEVRGQPWGGCVTYGDLECTVSVDNDVSYTFTVRASTDAGLSPSSDASTPVIPLSGKPKAATAVIATAGVESAAVRWTPGTGPAATSYTVTSWPHSKTCTTSSTSCVVSGLTAGQGYTFTVVASNSLGDAPASAASNSVTPTAAPGGGGGGASTPPPPPTSAPPPPTGGALIEPGDAGPTPTAPAAPAAVSGAKAKVKGKKVVVTWRPVAGATSYQVRTLKGKKASAWKTVSGLTFKTSLKKGKYVLEIKAVGPGGNGSVVRVKIKTK
jgi:Carboxypeptidase regulatory-like domain